MQRIYKIIIASRSEIANEVSYVVVSSFTDAVGKAETFRRKSELSGVKYIDELIFVGLVRK